MWGSQTPWLWLTVVAGILLTATLPACSRKDEDRSTRPGQASEGVDPGGQDPVGIGGPETPPATEPHPVEVFYATDRTRFEPTTLWRLRQFLGAAVALLLGLVLIRAARRVVRPEYPGVVRGLRLIAWVGCLGLAVGAGWEVLQVTQHKDRANTIYDGGRSRRTGGDLAPLELGRCVVSVPPVHAIGEVERPTLWTGDWFMKPDRHMIVLDVEPLSERAFFRDVTHRVAQGWRKDAFVFVHGFNVSFEEALLRTGQIAYDLGFEGAPICYSWPSQGQVTEYLVDAANVGWTVAHLTRFLESLRERTHAERIHLVAHSMGNRALTQALRNLAEAYPPGAPRPFQRVVLAAPDIDAETFREFIAPAILGTGESVTLYASENDQALLASRAVHGSPRAGEAGEGLVVIPGLETIDVSQVTGSHSYIGDNDWVLEDLRELLMHDRVLEEAAAFGIQEVERNGLRFWRMLAR